MRNSAPGQYVRRLQFSPTLSSLSLLTSDTLHLWYLDDPLTGAHPDSHKSLVALSHCGGYTAVGGSDGTVTITNLLSPTSSHIIDTGVTIVRLALTGNVLLVWDSKTIMAWLLTKEGAVAGVSANERAGLGNTIWIVSLSSPEFYYWDKVVTIRGIDVEGAVFHHYCPDSGEVLELTQQIPQYHHWLGFWEISQHVHNLHINRPDLQHNQSRCGRRLQWHQKGWVKGFEGKHQLWLPLEWRVYSLNWSCDGRALQLGYEEGMIIRF